MTHRPACHMKTRVTLIPSLLPFLFMQLSPAMERVQTAPGMLAEDNGLYEQVVEDKFLTSQIQLVLLEHRAVSQLSLTMVDPWPASLRFQLVGL